MYMRSPQGLDSSVGGSTASVCVREVNRWQRGVGVCTRVWAMSRGQWLLEDAP